VTAFVPSFIHAIGENATARVEEGSDPRRLDHVWITMRTSTAHTLTIAVNTSSLRSRDAGFDSRVRLGILREQWEGLPSPIFEPWQTFDYANIEKSSNIYYEPYERVALEALLLGFTQRAIRIEVWGMTYERHHQLGVHQIHSRRPSSAVPQEILARDGALRFYFSEAQETVLCLFKFCGQP